MAATHKFTGRKLIHIRWIYDLPLCRAVKSGGKCGNQPGQTTQQIILFICAGQKHLDTCEEDVRKMKLLTDDTQ